MFKMLFIDNKRFIKRKKFKVYIFQKLINISENNLDNNNNLNFFF